METSENLAALQAAIAKAQAEMHNPAFDSENPYFKSKFASLAAVRNAVIPPLAKHGVAVGQRIRVEDGCIIADTVAMGFGAEIVFPGLPIPPGKKDAHGMAGAGTYAKRTSMQAAFVVVGDDDDDGNTAVGEKPAPKHGPLDREALKVDGNHLAYAESFRNALEGGDISEIKNVHADCKEEGEEFYRAVWSLLNSKERSAVKKAIEQKEAA